MDAVARKRQAALARRVATIHLGGEWGLMDPEYNFREIAKNLILLEDHLAHTRKRCLDCIRKHCMTIEALADEAVTLDKTGIYQVAFMGLSNVSRQWAARLCGKLNIQALVQEIREVRKTMMPIVFDPRDMQSRVAARHEARHFRCAGHPTPAQLSYALHLVQQGFRGGWLLEPLTENQLRALDRNEISDLIDKLKKKRPFKPEFYGNGTVRWVPKG